MKKIQNISRARRLVEDTIKSLGLDLSDMTVLTEAASGNFIVTPLIAALAGARKVYVVCRDSKYGSVEEIVPYLYACMEQFAIPKERICYVTDAEQIAGEVNIVTNLGFVRPITADLIEKLPYDAAIPLMFESWEFRASDLDLAVCKRKGIPVLGTDEGHPALRIFGYVGMIALKLLLENQIEVLKSKILLISSGGYLEEVRKALLGSGAEILVYNPYEAHASMRQYEDFLSNCDAVVVAEQQYDGTLIGENGSHIESAWLLSCKPQIIHIAGVMDYDFLEKNRISKKPETRVGYGYMTVTTEYAGIRPVIELHTAGLKVGEALVKGLRKHRDPDLAMQYALEQSPAMPLEC